MDEFHLRQLTPKLEGFVARRGLAVCSRAQSGCFRARNPHSKTHRPRARTCTDVYSHNARALHARARTVVCFAVYRPPLSSVEKRKSVCPCTAVHISFCHGSRSRYTLHGCASGRPAAGAHENRPRALSTKFDRCRNGVGNRRRTWSQRSHVLAERDVPGTQAVPAEDGRGSGDGRTADGVT